MNDERVYAAETPVSQWPNPGEIWKHHNGNEYRVEVIANAESMREKYPVTVIYRNTKTGSVWSRRVDDWHRSMTFIR